MSMTRRQREDHSLTSFAEREQLRELTQLVVCPGPGCEQPMGSPCVDRIGEPLVHMDHPNRLRLAQLRELAITVLCPEPRCDQPIGWPCVDHRGEPLGQTDHPNRLRLAQAIKDRP